MDMSTETRETLARNVRIAMNLRGMTQRRNQDEPLATQ